MKCLNDTTCPRGHKCVDGNCMPIYATFRDWCHTYGTHISIPDRDFEIMSYDEYLKIVGEVENYIKSVPFTPCSLDQQCPEYYESTNTGACVPIMKTFKQWVETTGIGEYIPVPSSKLITHAEFVDIVNSTLKDLVVMNEIKEEMCKEIESREKVREYIESDIKLRHGSDIFERAKDWQKEYMEVMASYFR